VCGYSVLVLSKFYIVIKHRLYTRRIRGVRGRLKELGKSKIFKNKADSEESEGILLGH
jgi:hypothetical protein